ncbi:MAG: cadherin-like domain-containing protein [Sphingomicrobium sp.]
MVLSGRRGDLRGLFFDFNEAKLTGLLIGNDDGRLSSKQIGANKVIDLGHGANLNGLTKAKFDVGLEFGTAGIGKDLISDASFTLSNAAGNLTLDDIAHMRFGARLTSSGDKIMVVAPAAPDARDDRYDIHEDNSAVATHTPIPLVMNVLANDTDGDGEALTITAIHEQPAYGTIAISGDGKSLIYTPDADYAGTVTVEYCVSDGHGGQDSATATINLAAVADDPVLSWTVTQGATINQMIITVTANQSDDDSSEYLDSLVASVAGGLPAGTTLTPMSNDPAGQPDQIVQQFLLTTANDTDYDFDIDFTATSVETSNGDTETNNTVVSIVIDHASVTQNATFDAIDQSIWNNGAAFTFTDDRFLGVDTGNFNYSTGSVLYAGISGHVKLGFQSTLIFDGGNIDATSNYDLTVDSTYNRTTDWLNIDTSALLNSTLFNTVGPEGSYTLAFVYDLLLQAYAGVNVSFGELGSLSKQINIPAVTVGPGSLEILSIDSADLGGSITLPAPLDAFSIDFAWPHLTTSGSTTSSGSSNNFLQLNLDVDQVVADLAFRGVNPFDPPSLSAGPFYADADLLNVSVNAGVNFLQDFLMQMGSVQGILTFENGDSQAFTFGDSLFFGNASAIDAAGNHDGDIDFWFQVAPNATLHNETDLGFNVGAVVEVLSLTLGYDFEIWEDSTTLGPLATLGASVPVAAVEVYDSTFALNYQDNTYSFFIA